VCLNCVLILIVTCINNNKIFQKINFLIKNPAIYRSFSYKSGNTDSGGFKEEFPDRRGMKKSNPLILDFFV